ncbi:hypothetical protein WA026_001809 [Henosepilachna vigintioctopunctata]|uniref:Uncharacterized protein n=1 Tax=Henosepilachna vigintioctopunctata TaxID=420089 RepID=A0AAW1UUH0_9CUCU
MSDQKKLCKNNDRDDLSEYESENGVNVRVDELNQNESGIEVENRENNKDGEILIRIDSKKSTNKNKESGNTNSEILAFIIKLSEKMEVMQESMDEIKNEIKEEMKEENKNMRESMDNKFEKFTNSVKAEIKGINKTFEDRYMKFDKVDERIENVSEPMEESREVQDKGIQQIEQKIENEIKPKSEFTNQIEEMKEKQSKQNYMIHEMNVNEEQTTHMNVMNDSSQKLDIHSRNVQSNEPIRDFNEKIKSILNWEDEILMKTTQLNSGAYLLFNSREELEKKVINYLGGILNPNESRYELLWGKFFYNKNRYASDLAMNVSFSNAVIKLREDEKGK